MLSLRHSACCALVKASVLATGVISIVCGNPLVEFWLLHSVCRFRFAACVCVCVVSRCVSQAKTRPPAMPHIDRKPGAKTADSANEKIARDTMRKMFTAADELQEAASDMQTYARTNKSVSRKVGLYAADAACRLLIRMSWRNPIDPTTRCEGMALKASCAHMFSDHLRSFTLISVDARAIQFFVDCAI